MDDRSDESLVLAARGGDKGAYAALVRRHCKGVFLVCLGILGNIQDAEDVAQEVMLTGFRRIGSLRNHSQFRIWLTKIARNLSINTIRRRKCADKVTQTKTPQPAESKNDNDSLQWAIGKLSQDIRLPLVMYYLDGRSVKDVAERLGMSPSGVYVKLRTAVKQLHEILVERGESL